MTDLELTRNAELMVAQVDGLTEAGIDFVDAYTALDLVVVDAGRIIVPNDGVAALLARAGEHGLTTNA